MASNEVLKEEESLSTAQSLATHQFPAKPHMKNEVDLKSSSPSCATKKSGILANTSGRLYKAIRRNSSHTLPSKKMRKSASPQQHMKKKASLPALENIPTQHTDASTQRPKSTVELSGLAAGGQLNYQRPLPPRPPPSPDTTSRSSSKTDVCIPLEEEEPIVKTERDKPQDQASSRVDELGPSVNTEKPGNPLIENGIATKNASRSHLPSSVKTSPRAAHEASKMIMNTPITEPQLHRCNESQTLNMKDSGVNTTSMSMLLDEALKKYNHHFPLRIKVLEGYCSEDSEHNLSTNDIYDIHFVKQTRVITLKDSNGFMHQIPLASAMMFGLVYNPNNNLDEALAGHHFEKCSDIMAVEIMPQVVCATSQFESIEESHSIAKNEILVVKSIQKPKLRGKRSLKVFSLLTHTEKILPEECIGRFTTKPSLIQLHLPQMVQSISKPFPAQAVIYVNSDCPEVSKKLNIPLSGIITLCDCTTETSLVASSVSDDGSSEGQITLQLNDEMTQLEVEVISWRDVEDSTSFGSEMPADKAEHLPDEDLYDDVLVLKANRDPDDAYDDIVVTNFMVNSDEQTFGTQKNLLEPQHANQLQEGEYDSIPLKHVPDSLSPYRSEECNFEQST